MSNQSPSDDELREIMESWDVSEEDALRIWQYTQEERDVPRTPEELAYLDDVVNRVQYMTLEEWRTLQKKEKAA